MRARPRPASHVQGFPPIESPTARVLVLGSMPSERSLRERQYYGHPQNSFWWIMGELFDAGLELPYAERTRRLAAGGVALWDVLRRCLRPGSLDASIVRATEEPNDFQAFLARHRAIEVVFFNGSKAEEAWLRRVAPALAPPRPLRFERLPSTSAAHAGLSRAQKLARWRAVQRAAIRP